MNGRLSAVRFIGSAFSLAALFALCLAGCGREKAPATRDVSFMAAEQKAAPSAAARDASPEAPRKVIVTHSLTIETADAEAAFARAEGILKAAGGFTTESWMRRNEDGTRYGTVSGRVPPERVEKVLADLRAMGKVQEESSTGEDVTDQYVDLAARLGNARASEARLLELMGRRADKLADVLAVEKELTRVRGDIESMEARKRTLDTVTSLVAVSVSVAEPPKGIPALSRVWPPLKTALADALVGLSESLHVAIVAVGVLVPWLLLFGVPAVWLLKARRKRKKTAA